MPKSRPPYPPEFRRRIIELARAGRSVSSLVEEFGCTDVTIRNWLRQAGTDEGQRCEQAGVQPSMGSVGDAHDNAMCESFFASLECELLHRRTFRSRVEARMAIFQYIEGWHNPRRRHSALDYLSPANYERKHCATA